MLRQFCGAILVAAFWIVDPCSLLALNAQSPSVSVNSCPGETQEGILLEPPERRSKEGLLKLSLSVRSSTDALGHTRFCYIDEHGNEAPTLRVTPGDTLIIRLKNEISLPRDSSQNGITSGKRNKNARRQTHDPCAGGVMSASATNLHFHGLAVPPVCHQDETLKTLVEPGDPPFEYRIKIPATQPPGVYWYHPHVHGFSEQQILGGASGALIVEGIDKVVPRVAGLPERVFVIRDELMPDASPAEKPDPNRPTKQLSINHVMVPYPKYPTPQIAIKPLERQFWRVLNASADTYLDLRIEYGGKRQSFGLVALDGAPLHYGDPGAETYAPQDTHVFLPPASRAEFIVTGPPAGVSGILHTGYVFRGAEDDDRPILPTGKEPPALRMGQDDVDSARPLASIVASADAPTPRTIASAGISLPQTGVGLSGVRAVRKRLLYFSEELVDPHDPNSATRFFITEEGHTPVVFDPVRMEPAIIVHPGDVEDWTIENRSRESHTFHSHQLHFIVVGGWGVGWEEPTLRDTVNLPAWSGFGRYPSLIVRMDFRDPDIVGLIPFHCHIIQHLDGGMMGVIRVEPRGAN